VEGEKCEKGNISGLFDLSGFFGLSGLSGLFGLFGPNEIP
jgi:hypothetical protein